MFLDRESGDRDLRLLDRHRGRLQELHPRAAAHRHHPARRAIPRPHRNLHHAHSLSIDFYDWNLRRF